MSEITALFICIVFFYVIIILNQIYIENLKEQITGLEKNDLRYRMQSHFITNELGSIIEDIEQETKEQSFINSKKYLSRLKMTRQTTGL
jgi:predicted Holliday junction resolvase-like endonuclease